MDTQKIDDFCLALKKHAIEKAQLYDGVDRDMPLDTALRYAAEELGEVASEISRNRFHAIYYETLDLAHCAMLIAFAVPEGKR